MTLPRRAFLAVAAGVGVALSPLHGSAKPRKPAAVVYSNVYANTY